MSEHNTNGDVFVGGEGCEEANNVETCVKLSVESGVLAESDADVFERMEPDADTGKSLEKLDKAEHDSNHDERTDVELETEMENLEESDIEDKKPEIASTESLEHLPPRDIYRYKCPWFSCGTCAGCNELLTSRKHAKKHMHLRHARDTMYQCEYCQYKVRQKNRLTRHVASVHNKDTDFTPDTISYAPPVPVIKRQSDSPAPIRLLKCKYCFYETYTNHLRSHILSVHRFKSKLHRCRYCNFTTSKIVELGDHLLSHTLMKKFECCQCDYKTVRWQFLIRHCKIEHKECLDNGIIDLEAEKKRWKLELGLGNDPEHFRDIKDEIFICDQCNFTSVNHKKMSIHIVRTHQKCWSIVKREKDEKPVVEDIKIAAAQEDSNNSSDLQSESSQQSVEKPKKFYCPKCDYVTLYESLYHEHLACNHMKVQNVQWFRCDYCSFTSSYSHSVKRHYNTVHIKIRSKNQNQTPKIKTFECLFCEVVFMKKILLRRHLNRTHDEDRPYNCKLCDYKSATKPELIYHMRLHV